MPSRPVLKATALAIAVGALCGVCAALAHLPIPYLLGALLGSAVLVGFAPGLFPDDYNFPQPFRFAFVGVIGAMIGAQVDPEFVHRIPQLGMTLTGVAVFVITAHALSYMLFRRMGGYDRATAFFCGSPGGLLESITLGEAAGADVRVLTLHHFLRIILVVAVLPLGMSLVYGRALGSSAGEGFAHGAAELSSLPILLVLCAGGSVLGLLLRLPAAPLSGPMLLAGIGSGAGLIELNPPNWVTQVAQVVIGVSLGVRFIGVTRDLLWRVLKLSVVGVAMMLAIGAAIAEALHLLTGEPWDVLLISLTPGGVIEMGLIALSLSVNPAFVTVHHLFRIVLTVLEITTVGKYVIGRDAAQR